MIELELWLKRVQFAQCTAQVAGEGASSLRPKDQGHERQQTKIEIEVNA